MLGLGILYIDHGHVHIEYFSDADWAKFRSDKMYITSYWVFIERNLVPWKSKKQSVVRRLRIESKYKAMTQFTCEMCG